MAQGTAQEFSATTLGLATFARDTQWNDIPETVRHEGRRSLLNIFATALAGSGEPAIDKSLAALGSYASNAQCGMIGRRERGDMLLAAFVNAMSANIFDFDDTHPNTIIHPTAPVAPALFAYAETTPVDGQSLLRAFILGAEIECRIGNSVSPSHYGRGWHITSTCGVFGAAMAIGVLKGFNLETFAWALGNAAVQAAGMVEALGTMSKSISVGNAARNGITSALLAAEGFSGPAAPLDGERGFVTVYSDTPKPEALFDGLGEVWEIGKNTYKPYPVGVVLNPVMEACLDLHQSGAFKIEDVREIELTGHPLLRQRADRPDVSTGRESQVSAQHAIAIALRRGRAGLLEFNDEAVAETARDGIRPNLKFIDDESYDIESVGIRITTNSGEVHTRDIVDTRGGFKNPMTDRDIEKKLVALAEYGGFNRDVQPLVDAIWSIDSSTDAAEIMKLATLE
ncbi:MAG: MmgE/PrpD family protein [Alphaproteobacteria bacterium]|nr:MmgE/PrpD family protein [Alphaproteobacteria bacterium]